MILKLVLKSAQREKLRLATATFGVAAATGLFVWSLGLAMSVGAQSRIKAQRMSEPFNCWVSTSGAGLPLRRGSPPPPGFKWSGRAASLPPEVVARIKALPQIKDVLECSVIGATLDYRPDGRVMQGPPLSAALTLAPATGCPYANVVIKGEWPNPQDNEPQIAVCSSIFSPRRLTPPPLGSPLVLLTPAGALKARISAIIEMPQCVRGFPTVFATMGLLREASGGKFDPSPTLLLCRTHPTAPPPVAAMKAIATEYSAPSINGEPIITALERKEIESQFSSDSLRNFKRQAPLLLTLAVLTTLCMMVNALNVGVEQNQRILALLRAVGMTTTQILRVVAVEGALIALCGWLAGMLSGWSMLRVFIQRTPETFPEGVYLGWQTPVFSALGVAAIATTSLLWPCRRTLRIRPLDALIEHNHESAVIRENNKPGVRIWLGAAMLFPMLLLALPLHIAPGTRSLLILLVGMPLHFTGLLICLPHFVRLVAGLIAPPLGLALGLNATLLRQRLTHHTRRVAGMALTLAVGLGSFTAIHIWGASLMKPFIPTRQLPDVIVSILPNGIKGEPAGEVARLEGVEKNRCLAIEAAQFKIAPEIIEQARRASGQPPSFPNVLLWGADPQVAFGGQDPMANLRFAKGNRQTAAQALEQDDNCIVTTMFARETGLNMGDTVTLETRARKPITEAAQETPGAFGGPTRSKSKVKRFNIVGIVDLNWHLVTSRANMRGRHGMPVGTMGPLFVNERVARRMSGNHDTTFFLWLNFDPAYRALDELKAGQMLESGIRKTLAIDESNTIRVHHRDEIADGTIAHGAQLIGDMARAPFWSLIVLSTGIISMLIASHQASAHEFSLMRAVGLTRHQLARLLLGEAIMTGICGIALSLLSGICIGWTFTGWTRAWMTFGGLPLTFSTPWLLILKGICFAFALCVAMALPITLWLTKPRET